jgi:hypothetical protein
LRESLNKNPMVQIGIIGLLAVGVAFLLMTRVINRDTGGADEPAATETTPATTPADTAAPPAAGAPATEAPAVPAPTDSAVPPPATEAPAAEFAAGPGLPGKVVDAYENGDTVVLLVSRKDGIDDDAMRKTVNRFAGEGNVAFFDTLARGIADYSRVAQGVDVDRVPALIVLSPKSVSGDVPSASVSYGFRGPDSVKQAIADAGFEGRDVPYFPE